MLKTTRRSRLPFLSIALCALVLPVLTACGDGSGEASMFREIGKGMGMGGAAGAGSQAPATGAAKMLNDPDDPYHSQIIDYVWGDTREAAAAKCQDIARQNGLRYRTVRQTSKGGKRWECHVDNL